jgi:hypothetical protein
MNLIHLNLMAGVSLDHQSKETPAMKSSGKMGNSPNFPVFLRAKWKNPAVYFVDRSRV